MGLLQGIFDFLPASNPPLPVRISWGAESDFFDVFYIYSYFYYIYIVISIIYIICIYIYILFSLNCLSFMQRVHEFTVEMSEGIGQLSKLEIHFIFDPYNAIPSIQKT